MKNFRKEYEETFLPADDVRATRQDILASEMVDEIDILNRGGLALLDYIKSTSENDAKIAKAFSEVFRSGNRTGEK